MVKKFENFLPGACLPGFCVKESNTSVSGCLWGSVYRKEADFVVRKREKVPTSFEVQGELVEAESCRRREKLSFLDCVLHSWEDRVQRVWCVR